MGDRECALYKETSEKGLANYGQPGSVDLQVGNVCPDLEVGTPRTTWMIQVLYLKATSNKDDA